MAVRIRCGWCSIKAIGRRRDSRRPMTRRSSATSSSPRRWASTASAKHQKIEDPRYLYWADRLGLLVWTEMPSAYRFTTTSIQRTTREWMDVIQRDYSHPCVVAWVPFNESWGVPNLPNSAAERHYVRGLFHLTKTLDPTRPVVGNDGWESVATDIIGIHDYDPDPRGCGSVIALMKSCRGCFAASGRGPHARARRQAPRRSAVGVERVWRHYLLRRSGDMGLCTRGSRRSWRSAT